MVLTRPVTPSSLELCQEIGNVIGVLNSDAEVVGVVREFPEVIGVDDKPSADALLQAGIELVAAVPAGWASRLAPKTFCARPAAARGARKEQVLVERRFEGPWSRRRATRYLVVWMR